VREKSKSKSRQSNLPPIREVSKISNPQAVVIYGAPGAGKTTIAATWPKPILLIDFNDRGTDSISDEKSIDVAQVETLDELEALYWMLKDGSKYETVVFDTVTGMQDMIMDDISGKRSDNLKWGSLTRKQFGEVVGECKKYITDFRDLDMNVLFLAQQRIFNLSEDDDATDDIPPEIGPAMMPSLTRHLNAACGIIAQAFKRSREEKKKVANKIRVRSRTEYCLFVGPDPVRTTKIRKPKSIDPPSFLIDPTYGDLMAIIKGE
jgi:hypothetical protein